jgi:hypothetical protein
MVAKADIWYPVNAYAGRLMIRMATVMSLFSLICLLVPGLDPIAYTILQTGVLVALLWLLAALTVRYLSKLTPR